jgi:hypothetical protein
MNWIQPLRNDEKEPEVPPGTVAIEHEGEATVYIQENGVRMIEGKIGRRLRKGEIRKGVTQITKETAGIMRERRWEMAQKRAEEGMQAAVNEVMTRLANGKPANLAKQPVDAMYHITKHATEVFLESRSPKGLSDLGGFLTRVTQMTPNPDERHHEDSGLPMPTLDEARNIINIFNFYQNEYEPENVVDGKVIE